MFQRFFGSKPQEIDLQSVKDKFPAIGAIVDGDAKIISTKDLNDALETIASQRQEIDWLRAALTGLRSRLIEVNKGNEMGGIDCELVATINCALGSPSEPSVALCGVFHAFAQRRCELPAGHEGVHENGRNTPYPVTW